MIIPARQIVRMIVEINARMNVEADAVKGVRVLVQEDAEKGVIQDAAHAMRHVEAVVVLAPAVVLDALGNVQGAVVAVLVLVAVDAEMVVKENAKDVKMNALVHAVIFVKVIA